MQTVLAMALCTTVCVDHKTVFYRNGWTDRAGFRCRGFLDLFYAVFLGNSGISRNNGTSLWNFVLNSFNVENSAAGR